MLGIHSSLKWDLWAPYWTDTFTLTFPKQQTFPWWWGKENMSRVLFIQRILGWWHFMWTALRILFFKVSKCRYCLPSVWRKKIIDQASALHLGQALKTRLDLFLPLLQNWLQCPNKTDLANFTAAVKRGDITWHAGPMNMQAENAGEELFQFGLSLSDRLDKRFGISRQFRTPRQRDVPGNSTRTICHSNTRDFLPFCTNVLLVHESDRHSSVLFFPGMTRAVIPSLVKMNISGVSVGVNEFTAAPAVPKGAFMWKYNDQSVMATWHPGTNLALPNSCQRRSMHEISSILVDWYADQEYPAKSRQFSKAPHWCWPSRWQQGCFSWWPPLAPFDPGLNLSVFSIGTSGQAEWEEQRWHENIFIGPGSLSFSIPRLRYPCVHVMFFFRWISEQPGTKPRESWRPVPRRLFGCWELHWGLVFCIQDGQFWTTTVNRGTFQHSKKKKIWPIVLRTLVSTLFTWTKTCTKPFSSTDNNHKNKTTARLPHVLEPTILQEKVTGDPSFHEHECGVKQNDSARTHDTLCGGQCSHLFCGSAVSGEIWDYQCLTQQTKANKWCLPFFQEILGYYEILREEFPDAQLKASTFENFFSKLNTIKDKLPVYEKEIGDTWMQGIGTDPKKTALYRAFYRSLSDCLKSGQCARSKLHFGHLLSK